GRVGARLCLGVLAMLVFAAFVEAFWSSTGSIPAPVKFGVGALLWALVLGWLALAGRGVDPWQAPVRARRRGGPPAPPPAGGHDRAWGSTRPAWSCARARPGRRWNWAWPWCAGMRARSGDRGRW